VNPVNPERKALGRGLAALMGDGAVAASAPRAPAPIPTTSVAAPIATPTATAPSPYQVLELKLIEANPEQPRKTFNQSRLEELAESLRERGLVQPILVRKKGEKFQIIAGERRWRAAQLAGLVKIPVVVREAQTESGDDDLASVVENIQREELNAVELSIAYDRLLKKYSFTQEQLAKKLGVSRVSLANTLRLLKLPESVKELIKQGRLSEGHSRALLALEDQKVTEEIAQQVVAQGLTVREVETLVRQKKEISPTNGGKTSSSSIPSQSVISSMAAVEEELRRIFGTKVSIRGAGVRGSIEIVYTGEDSFRRILHQIRAIPG
jgi:ParB family chromosome partitioning protein